MNLPAVAIAEPTDVRVQPLNPRTAAIHVMAVQRGCALACNAFGIIMAKDAVRVALRRNLRIADADARAASACKHLYNDCVFTFKVRAFAIEGEDCKARGVMWPRTESTEVMSEDPWGMGNIGRQEDYALAAQVASGWQDRMTSVVARVAPMVADLARRGGKAVPVRVMEMLSLEYSVFYKSFVQDAGQPVGPLNQYLREQGAPWNIAVGGPDPFRKGRFQVNAAMPDAKLPQL